ncbi:hypothetical protein [Bradyrhizobium sp.]|uniref:hypothetical protein n=1 Tax=Bradyrhizobium sp. TaxID=376 RepID=UPI0027325CFD|nr:hypothetical protein [Bradyrhizobium sp.]MDP3078666.1 hypothetical protein [Bradyrhizobium sp.]
MPRSKAAMVEELERLAASNIATADQLESNGADRSFTKELRDRAAHWWDMAERLKSAKRRKRGKA